MMKMKKSWDKEYLKIPTIPHNLTNILHKFLQPIHNPIDSITYNLVILNNSLDSRLLWWRIKYSSNLQNYCSTKIHWFHSTEMNSNHSLSSSLLSLPLQMLIEKKNPIDQTPTTHKNQKEEDLRCKIIVILIESLSCHLNLSLNLNLKMKMMKKKWNIQIDKIKEDPHPTNSIPSKKILFATSLLLFLEQLPILLQMVENLWWLWHCLKKNNHSQENNSMWK